MDITQFTEELDSETPYTYKMLIYGNYTFRENLEADSLVVVLRNVIPFLSERYSIHFTILVPELIKSLSFPNVEQVIYNLPSYCNTMRAHFDANRFLDIIDWRHKDFDIIYSHVPEHTAQIANVVFNNTHLQPKMIGYSHWFEVDENAPYDRTLFDQAIIGTLHLDELGVNSKWLKNLVLKRAKKTFNETTIQQLDKIIQPHYLGVDTVRPRNQHFNKKTVMFNHRPSAYTGWNWFVERMDELWKIRQDFTVYTTLTEVDRPWNTRVNTPTRHEYLAALSKSQFGVGCFQKYSAWSVSVTDGLSVGVPYLLPNGLCYPEMVPSSYPYLYKTIDEFFSQFNDMLDRDPYIPALQTISSDMLWDNRIDKWFGGWSKIFDMPGVKTSEVLPQIIELIRSRRSVTKSDIMSHFGWGVQVKWTPYRNALRNHANIKLYKDRYEWVS